MLAEPIGAVAIIEPGAPLHRQQAVEGEPGPFDGGRVRGVERGQWRSEVHGCVGHRPALRGAVVRHRLDGEQRADRIADPDLIAEGVHDAIVSAQARDPVGQAVQAELVAPVEVVAGDRDEAEAHIPAAVHDAADVLRLRGLEASAWRQEHRHNGVVDFRPKDRRLDAEAVAKEAGIEAAVDFRGLLRTELEIARALRYQRRRVREHGDRPEGLERVERAGRLARGADCSAQLEAAYPRGEPGVLDVERDVDFRIGLIAVAGAEGAVAVHAHADRGEELVTEVEAVLRQRADLHGMLVQFSAKGLRRRSDRGDAGAGELLADRGRALFGLVEPLPAKGEGRADSLGEVEVECAEVVHRVDGVVALGVDLLAVRDIGRPVVPLLREEALLRLADDVGTDRETIRERRHWREGHGASAGPPVCIARRNDLLDVRDGNPRLAVGPQRRGLPRIAVLRVAGERRPVVARLKRVDVVAREGGSDIEGELIGGGPIHIQPHVPLALVVRLNASDFLLVTARHVIRGLAGAALHVGVVRLEWAVLDQRLVHVEGAGPVGADEVRVQVCLIVLPLPVQASAEAKRPLRRALGLAALRENLDHAVGRLRSVQRGSGGPLQYLDVVDVIGIDVRQPVFAGAAVEVAAGLVAEVRRPVGGAGVGADTIDVHHRSLVEGETGGAADAQILCAAYTAAHACGAQASDLTFENRAEIGGRLQLGDLAGVHDADRRAELALRDRTAGAGRDDLVQGNGALLKRKGDAYGITTCHLHGASVGPEAESLRSHNGGASADAAQGESPAPIGGGGQRRARNCDNGTAQGLAARLLDDGADDNACLLRLHGERCGDERECQRPAREAESVRGVRRRETGCHESPQSRNVTRPSSRRSWSGVRKHGPGGTVGLLCQEACRNAV